MHFADDGRTISAEHLEQIPKALSEFKGQIQKCCVIVTGDIAYSGKRMEYLHATAFFNALIPNLRSALGVNEYVEFLAIPGNHDLDYTLGIRDQDTMQNYFKTGIPSKELLQNEETFFSEYLVFAKHRKIQDNNDLRFVSSKILKMGNIGIKFNMINSAVFSSLDNDKGWHYLPEPLMDRLFITDEDVRNGVEFAFTAMHHHYEWFHESNKTQFERALFSGTSILFLGHEHIPSSKSSILNGDQSIAIIAGGILSDNKTPASSFNSVIIDTELNNFVLNAYNWDERKKIYIPKKTTLKLHKKKAAYHKLYPDSEFYDWILQDEKHTISNSFLDYYVFPRLRMDSPTSYISEENKEICDFDCFLSQLENAKCIIIKGDDNAGKTAFLKYIYAQLSKTKIPLFFDAEEIKEKRIKNIVKITFNSQIATDDASYALFMQTEKSEKIALIDNAGNIKKDALDKLLKELNNYFSCIIMTTKREWEFDVIEFAKSEFELRTNCIIYRLTSFYSDKREALIQKICKSKHEIIDLNNIDSTINSVNKSLKSMLPFIYSNPNTLIQYIDFFINMSVIGKTNKENMFGAVFENDIINSLRRNIKDTHIDMSLILLEEIAFYIHANKKYPIPLSDLQEIIENYNFEYGASVTPKNFFGQLEKSKIMKFVNQNWEIKFCNKNYLAFFVARRINRQINEGEGLHNLQAILTNICFGINSDIIMFLSYLTQNIRILSIIYNQIIDNFAEWKEFNISEANITFLSFFSELPSVALPEDSEKREFKEMQLRAEMVLDDESIIETTDIYDYDEADLEKLTNQLLTAIKYTEIIAKSLPNFAHMLKKDMKQQFTKAIYEMPNKIFYQLLHEIDKNYDEITSELLTYFSENNKKIKTKDDIDKLMVSLSIAIMLSLYDFAASCSVDDNTINILDDYYDKENLNYEIENLLMHENLGNADSFIKKAENLNKSKNPLVQHCVQKIVKVFLMRHDNIDASKELLLRDKFFDSSQRKAILVEKIKRNNS